MMNQYLSPSNNNNAQQQGQNAFSSKHIEPFGRQPQSVNIPNSPSKLSPSTAFLGAVTDDHTWKTIGSPTHRTSITSLPSTPISHQPTSHISMTLDASPYSLSSIPMGPSEVEDIAFGNNNPNGTTSLERNARNRATSNPTPGYSKDGLMLTPVPPGMHILQHDDNNGSRTATTNSSAWQSSMSAHTPWKGNSPSPSSIWDKAGGMVTASPNNQNGRDAITPDEEGYSKRVSFSGGYDGSSPSDDDHDDLNMITFKNVITHQPLRDDTSNDLRNAGGLAYSKSSSLPTAISSSSRVRSKSFNSASYGYVNEDLLYGESLIRPNGNNGVGQSGSVSSAEFPELLWGDDRAPGMHRRASTVPTVYPGLWDTPSATSSLMERTPPVMEDPVQQYYRQGRRFSHAPTLYQDWHNPHVDRTGALDQEYDLQHLSPGALDSRRRHSLAGPPMYPQQQQSSAASRYLNDALESLHLEDSIREILPKPTPIVTQPLRTSNDYSNPTPLRTSNDYNMPSNSLRTSNDYNGINDFNGMRQSADELVSAGLGMGNPSNTGGVHTVPSLADAPLYDEINDYFENTEHRTRAWVEAGKNLQMATSHLVHWPLYIVEFKAGRMDYFYVGEQTGLIIRKGDLVIVEADRGKDLGKVVVEGILNPQQLAMHQSVLGDGLLSGVNALSGSDGSNVPANGGQLGPKDIHPKRIYRVAQQGEVSQLVSKNADEARAQSLCQAKIRQRKLPMEIVDAEYQWDRRKLTFYFVADRRIDFRELVRELFKIYKTRIWMCAVSPMQDQQQQQQQQQIA
ncbi:hypothetical protein SmJEL517_g01987 [Synchytrium microbalum]|uniref:PSP1 C-terminal domain-containing protein n=1 Tax=Synchytrium microbalum TaxID=1806994 RepID=A0A507C7R2_9FUNG|nr:uncharacterized protein SmJEL517_g01987 [Synchytrium microbalum]TPX35642.1 hypothetical protein SmJEL517_g01987 [Synchytrium microbalum]